MATRFARGPYALSLIAETGDRFADFSPYVAAIDDAGAVVFTAALAAGGSGVFQRRAGEVTSVAESASGVFHEVCSHPDLDGTGAVCFYAEDASGTTALYRAQDGEVIELHPCAGPLGPTVNDGGTIAFRAPLTTGGEGVFSSQGGVTMIADTGERFGTFHGLPVVDRAGRVVFRADGRDGREGIYVHDDEQMQVVVETGDRFRSLGLFPFANDAGTIVFCGELRSGGAGVFLASPGSFVTLIDSAAGFESFRGALVNSAGELVFYATPTSRQLGIYTGPDPSSDCLLEVGGRLFGSTVVGFALNPVSINGSGQLAIRVVLESGRQLILRADPLQRGARAAVSH